MLDLDLITPFPILDNWVLILSRMNSHRITILRQDLFQLGSFVSLFLSRFLSFKRVLSLRIVFNNLLKHHFCGEYKVLDLVVLKPVVTASAMTSF